jgi:hypothetical protein
MFLLFVTKSKEEIHDIARCQDQLAAHRYTRRSSKLAGSGQSLRVAYYA